MKASDTSPFVGHTCPVCKKPVHVSKNTGYYSVDPKTREVQAWHVACKLNGS
jgi:hypothetical protein